MNNDNLIKFKENFRNIDISLNDVYSNDKYVFTNEDDKEDFVKYLRSKEKSIFRYYQQYIFEPMINDKRYKYYFRHPMFWDELFFHSHGIWRGNIIVSNSIVKSLQYGSPLDKEKILALISEVRNYCSEDHERNASWILEKISCIENHIKSNNITKKDTNNWYTDTPVDIRNTIIELIKMLRKSPVDSKLLGSYSWGKNQITLYLRSIVETAHENNLNADKLLLSVLSHEVFHKIHYIYLWLCRKSSPDNYEWKVVTESLASYSEYEIARNILEDDSLCYYLKDLWGLSDLEHWPYAGAASIVTIKEKIKKDFVYEDDFYIIAKESIMDYKKLYDRIKVVHDFNEAFSKLNVFYS